MGCTSCSSDNGLPAGCKNNGVCGTYGCNKLDVFDWLAGVPLPDGQKGFDVVEVRFKNSRKVFYRNSSGFDLFQGDVVVVDVSPGHDVGVVSLTGELVRVQMKKKEVKDNYELKKIIRKASPEDIELWQEARKLEQNTMMRAREIAHSFDLQMKISDVEYQGDKAKATFFYTADDRVDFRELIRRYAETFRVKIEMRQIGLRVEAGRLGGIGSCGRELCCSTWLTDFRAVSTSAARYQQLSLNPAKLAGQCGKLKCCLNYELDQYVEALRGLPANNIRLKLPKGVALHLKTDIFKQVMFYVYDNQPGEPPFALSADAVKEIIERNKRGEVIGDVEQFMPAEDVSTEPDFAEVVGQDSLTRFDKKKRTGPRPPRGRGRDGRSDGRNETRPENRGENRGEGRADSGRPPRREGPQKPPGQGGQSGPEKKAPEGGRPPQQQNKGREGGPPRGNQGEGRGPTRPRPQGPPKDQGKEGPTEK